MKEAKPQPISAKSFFVRRGYKVPLKFGDVVWRWFFVSFTKPAFGGFWRVWNPYIGYFLGKLYRLAGGDGNRFVACLVTFAVCGFGHDLLTLITSSGTGMRLKMTMVFLVFGLFVVATSPLRIQRRLRKLPSAINVVLNLLHIAIGFKIGGLLWETLRDHVWPW